MLFFFFDKLGEPSIHLLHHTAEVVVLSEGSSLSTEELWQSDHSEGAIAQQNMFRTGERSRAVLDGTFKNVSYWLNSLTDLELLWGKIWNDWDYLLCSKLIRQMHDIQEFT